MRMQWMRRERWRLTTLLNAPDSGLDLGPTRHYPPLTGRPYPDLHQRHYQETLHRLQDQQAVLERRLAHQQAEIQAAEARERGLSRVMPLIAKRTVNLSSLVEKQMAPEQQLLELQQERLLTSQRLDEARANLAAGRARQQELQGELALLSSRAREEWLDELNDLEAAVESLEQRRKGLVSQIERRVLRAPLGGRVQQLRLRAPGEVVNPGEPLMKLVPGDGDLRIEAWLAGADIGFVIAGQTADIKVDAFPFSRYGTLSGKVVSVSADAVERQSLPPAYLLRLALKEGNADNPGISLLPGMAVTVEIKTGGRRLIDYFLSTLLRYGDESLRER